MTFLLGCLASRWRHVTLAFDFIDLLLHHGKPVDLALDLTGDSRRQAATVSGNERVDGQSLVLRFDFEAAGVNHKALYAPRLEEPCKPKGVVTHFVAKRDRRHSATRLRPTIPRRGELRHQAFSIAASHRVNAWLLMVRKLDRQKPTVLAQF